MGAVKERSNIYNEAEALCLHPGYVRVPATLKRGGFVGAAWRRGSAGVFKDRQAALHSTVGAPAPSREWRRPAPLRRENVMASVWS